MKEVLYEVRCLKSNEDMSTAPASAEVMRQLLKLSSECEDHIFIYHFFQSKKYTGCGNLQGFYLKVLVIKKPKTLNKSYQSLRNFEMSSEFCSYLRV